MAKRGIIIEENAIWNHIWRSHLGVTNATNVCFFACLTSVSQFFFLMLGIFVSQIIKIPIKSISVPDVTPQNGKLQGSKYFFPLKGLGFCLNPFCMALLKISPKGQAGKWPKWWPLSSGQYTLVNLIPNYDRSISNAFMCMWAWHFFTVSLLPWSLAYQKFQTGKFTPGSSIVSGNGATVSFLLSSAPRGQQPTNNLHPPKPCSKMECSGPWFILLLKQTFQNHTIRFIKTE